MIKSTQAPHPLSTVDAPSIDNPIPLYLGNTLPKSTWFLCSHYLWTPSHLDQFIKPLQMQTKNLKMYNVSIPAVEFISVDGQDKKSKNTG